jgi:hypothetical protein
VIIESNPQVPDPEQLEVIIDGNEFIAMECFHRWGWTDGLPIVLPTRENVAIMCKSATRYPIENLGNLAPRNGPATVQKIAINAVMAGCLPEYMPVIIAAVEAIQDPLFNLIGVQTTTHSCALMIIVHGPIATELHMNAGHNCFGQGNRANATIGRAMRLILQNIGGGIPGKSDKSTQGSPAKYTYCFAENEEASPWPPFRVSLGFDITDSCITVVAAEGPHNINDHGSTTGESVLGTVAQTMATVGNNNLYVGGDTFVVFGPEHARTIADSGFSREDVQRYLYEHARVSVDRIPQAKLEEISSWGGWSNRIAEWGGRIPLVREFESIRVLVAGGAGKHSAWCPTFAVTYSATRRIVWESSVCKDNICSF